MATHGCRQTDAGWAHERGGDWFVAQPRSALGQWFASITNLAYPPPLALWGVHSRGR